MKKILIVISICLIAAVIYGATTETPSIKTIDGQESLVKKVTVATDANEGTETLASIYGYLERLVIDATGTDIDYTVTLKDENAITLFTKTDCNTVDGDYSYAISESDVDANLFSGVPVAGTGSVVWSDANDLTSLSVIIYYRQQPQ